jgi:Flp pilus assembly protein TadB
MNINLISALLGILMAAGVLLAVSGAVKRVPLPASQVRTKSISNATRLRIYSAFAAGFIVLLITRWPVMAFGAMFVGWFRAELFGGKKERMYEIERTEAIASWVEMLRDTLSAAHGLEAAISTTAANAPAAIRPEVQELAIRLQRESLENALVDFGSALAHPIGDLIVTALTLAAGGAARDLNELLGTLAESARDEATIRLKIDASRARARSSVRIITGFTGIMALGFPLLSAEFLEPYNSVQGQLVLGVIVAIWGGSFVIIRRMSEIKMPGRFLESASTRAEVRL